MYEDGGGNYGDMKVELFRFGKRIKPGERSKERRRGVFGLVIFLIAVLIITATLAYSFQLVLCHQVVEEDTWISSIASYWGGIIGGMVSGVLAFGGVFLTIRYYKESDRKKEMASIQPFLQVSTLLTYEKDVQTGFSLGKLAEEKESKRIDVEIKNIGNGFANTIVIHTSESDITGKAFNKVIAVGETTHTFFKIDPEELNNGLVFAIQFIDSMTNEYIQQYTLKKEYGSTIIECGYPDNLEP